jgi:RHS repeat-associated protein
MVVSAAGAIENESDYYPWGGELKISAADSGNHYKFTGKERDETGLDYFGARYYSNALGRFTSPDPYWKSARAEVPQTWNRYAYVHNNPLSFVDWEGLIDYYVFRPLYNSDGPTWSAIKAQAAKQGDSVTVYNGKDASTANFYKAMGTDGARVITAGHTLTAAVQERGGQETAGSVELKNRDGGDIGVGTMGEFGRPHSQVPAPDPSEVAAQSLAVFGCHSSDLADQYPSLTFTGVNTYFEPDEEGAAAYTTTLLNGGTFEQAGAAAQQAMQDSVAQDNQTREHPDPMPEVKTRDKEDKSPN